MSDVTVPQKVIDEYKSLTADGFDTLVLTLENGEVTGQMASNQGTTKDDFRTVVYETLQGFNHAYLLHALTGGDGTLKWTLGAWENTETQDSDLPGDPTGGTEDSVARQLGGITKVFRYNSLYLSTEDDYKRSGIPAKLTDL
ncbi:hypothetical protein [Streptomyces sp. NPDC092903]|uniref:hypothetical protein n=1 Tax=Streptomyces sp. NPDC092903 TaxID=3366017 RepID=UPI00380B3891